MKIKNFNYPDNMDIECIALCDLFNTIGLETEYSCCGHGKHEFMILFSDMVSTSDIDKFLMKLKNKYNHTPLLGRFIMWSRKIDGVIKHTWMYTVPTIKWANNDYEVIVSQI